MNYLNYQISLVPRAKSSLLLTWLSSLSGNDSECEEPCPVPQAKNKNKNYMTWKWWNHLREGLEWKWNSSPNQPDLLLAALSMLEFSVNAWEITCAPTTFANIVADSLWSSVSPTYSISSNLFCKIYKYLPWKQPWREKYQRNNIVTQHCPKRRNLL